MIHVSKMLDILSVDRDEDELFMLLTKEDVNFLMLIIPPSKLVQTHILASLRDEVVVLFFVAPDIVGDTTP